MIVVDSLERPNGNEPQHITEWYVYYYVSHFSQMCTKTSSEGLVLMSVV